MLQSTNAQNEYLYGLITVMPVSHRRPRKPENEAKLRDITYKFKVSVRSITCNNFIIFHCFKNYVIFIQLRVPRDDVMKEVTVCRHAFLAIH